MKQGAAGSSGVSHKLYTISCLFQQRAVAGAAEFATRSVRSLAHPQPADSKGTDSRHIPHSTEAASAEDVVSLRKYLHHGSSQVRQAVYHCALCMFSAAQSLA